MVQPRTPLPFAFCIFASWIFMCPTDVDGALVTLANCSRSSSIALLHCLSAMQLTWRVLHAPSDIGADMAYRRWRAIRLPHSSLPPMSEFISFSSPCIAGTVFGMCRRLCASRTPANSD